MTFRSTDTATSIISGLSWFALAVVSFVAVWNFPGMWFWFRLPLAVALGMASVGYGVESLAQEMTVRRWAIGQFVFTTFAVAFIVAGIFNAEIFGFNRWVITGSGAFFGLAALVSALEAKELF